MNIPFVRHRLDNGLDVLIHADQNCPIVAVNVWYHVGSKNERPGRTGFAHLFEHLMFEGSRALRQRLSSIRCRKPARSLNGSTNADRTNYWEVVPSNALELALWMESDRMGYLLPALTDAKFENQRDVVLNERRQKYENRPYGLAGMAIVAALYPPDHPYHWLTIGAAEDISAARIDDVREFFRTYYRPPNASLSIAGDVQPDEALRLAEDYFGELEAGEEPPPFTCTPPEPRASESRLVLEDRVELPRLYLAWHSPALFATGDAELDLVAEVLASGKTSRLYRTLVFEQRLATEVAASQNSREAGSFFQIVATAAPGRTLVELERAITDEIDRFIAERTDGDRDGALPRPGRGAVRLSPADRRRVRRQGRSAERLQRVPRRARLLRSRPRALPRAPAPRRCSARRRDCLRPETRVVLSVVPKGRTALALADSQPAVVA